MINTRGHLSSETIDLLLLSALDAGEANAAKAHLDDCELCKTRWRELNEDKQRFEQFVFARTLPKVEARVARERSLLGRLQLRWLLPVAAVAAAAGVALTVSGPGTQSEDEVYIGVKGSEPGLQVVALRGATQFAVKSGATLKPKDRLRFVVNPAGAKYVLVASRDAAGVFSVYHPFGARQSERIPPAQLPQRVQLSSTVELDETPGAEHLVAVFSEEPVTAQAVEAALQANPTAPQLPGARVLSWEFVKEAP